MEIALDNTLPFKSKAKRKNDTEHNSKDLTEVLRKILKIAQRDNPCHASEAFQSIVHRIFVLIKSVRFPYFVFHINHPVENNIYFM